MLEKLEWGNQGEISGCSYLETVWIEVNINIKGIMIKIVLKRGKECGTYLATARRHRWRLKMTMKIDR